MNRIYSILGGLIIAFSLFIFLPTSLVYAGGPVGSMYADTQGWTSDIGYGRNIRFFWGIGIPCSGVQVTFKFTDSQPGDYIMTSSGNDTVTIDSSCGVYAKMASKNSATRSVTAVVKAGDKTYTDPYVPTIKVDFDGQYHGDSAYNGYEYRSSVDDPLSNFRGGAVNPTPQVLPTIKDDIKVWLIDHRYDRSVNKYGGQLATIKWTAVNVSGWKVLYDIYITGSNGQTSVRESEQGPSATLYLDNDIDYKVWVKACINKVGNCKDSNTITISRVEKTNKQLASPSVNPMNLQSPAPTNVQNSDQLNQKINDLQNQLDESKRNQSALEQEINSLVNFIKKLFPFFK